MLMLFCLSLVAPVWIVLNPQPVAANPTFTTPQYLGQVGTTEFIGNNASAISNNYFQWPIGVAVDASNNVFISDYWTVRKVSVAFSPSFSATYRAHVGTPGNSSFHPQGLFLTGNNLYVAEDTANDAILRYDTTAPTALTFQNSFGIGSFSQYPFDLVQGSNGTFYVSDYGANSVKVFNSNGTLNTISSLGLSNPRDITIDSLGNLYVADTGNNRILVINSSSGAIIRQWGSSGSGDGQLNQPFGLAIDRSDRVFVTDSGNNRVQVFDSSGTFLGKWGSGGSGNGQFSGLASIALDSFGRVYVADVGNHRVQVFSNPIPLATWGR